MLVAMTALSRGTARTATARVLPTLFHAGSSLMGAMVSRVMDPGARRRPTPITGITESPTYWAASVIPSWSKRKAM
jgi:hypothetical protein